MPKKVDHHARRTQIADALMRVAATHGLQAVSLRHVAAEAGVSTGMVQHYFHTKDQMMTFALDAVSDKVQARLEADAAGLPEERAPRAVVRALVVQLLPLDEPRLLEGHVALAFHAYSAVKPAIAADLRANSRLMRAFIADQVRVARATVDDTDRIDPDHAATGLLALVEGLSMQVLVGYHSPDAALAVLDAQLDVIFGQSARPDGQTAEGSTTEGSPAG
ncbi:TetR/AcrR family transcriptional regulator [Actinopolymorpha alba]|uniref:TetR/AcrR family transcriptional regulator n=1 Tax=Actinopolymorpha alba TaxID=533267 RepID=UPI00036B216D|nr:TetR family transcriptional regulator C-terminal domain-containing protein [Actinopolymorpha alba]